MRIGAPSKTGAPAISTQACTETTAPAAGGRGSATREPISASSGCASRQPSTVNVANYAKPAGLGNGATAAANAAAACSAVASSPPIVTVRRTQLPL